MGEIGGVGKTQQNGKEKAKSYQQADMVAKNQKAKRYHIFKSGNCNSLPSLYPKLLPGEEVQRELNFLYGKKNKTLYKNYLKY